jgi:hypothetical protein
MTGMIVSLTACVFLCGAIAYLLWFGNKIRAAGPPRRYTLLPPSGSMAVERQGLSAHTARIWYKRLLALISGVCAAGFCFVVSLSGYLSPGNRPISPEAALGYTHYIRGKYAGVYVTYFEYLAVTYGIWVPWGGLALIGMIVIKLKVDPMDGSQVYPLLSLAGSAISMVLYFILWQACLHAARV